MISKRARSIDSSGIRKIFDLAAKLKDPVNLSIGQADFDAWDVVKAGAHHAIDNRHNTYTQTQGIPALREGIAKKHRISSDQDVIITSGVSGGILLSYMAILDPGDEILIPDPFFVMYRDLATVLNAVPTYYDTYPDFGIRAEEVERAITPRTKAVLLCSPSNPTGYMLRPDELNAVVEIAKRHNIWLIYDEIYEVFAYDHPHINPFGQYDKVLLLNGFSKSHGITGWRVGYAAGPKEIINEMAKLQQYSFVCAPSIAQHGMVPGLDIDFTATANDYRAKRDFMYDALKTTFNVERSSGAFYLFPEAPGGSGQRFVERCVENGLLVVPGNVFSRRDSHFRISFSAPQTMLERGAEILLRLAKES